MNQKLPLPVSDPATGHDLLVAGYTGAFFLPPAIHEHVAFLQTALARYLKVVPPNTLRWQAVGAGAEEWRPTGNATLAKCLDQLRPEAARRRDLTSIELRSGADESDASQWSITIIGNPVDSEMPQENTLFEFTLPASTFEAVEAEGAARLFMQFAVDLPFKYAYFSPAMLWSPVLEDEALTRARTLAMRYPGLDVSRNAVARSFLGKRVRGARWITLLNAELTASLGGLSVMETASQALFDTVPYKSGAALRAGLAPALKADTEHAFRAMCGMAQVLEPITAHDEEALPATEFAPDDDDEFVLRWERRFLK